ncbi:unnamed protein product, partial [Rotaria sp. Silwood1]
GQYPKNDIWRLYEILARIYTLLQLPNENTNSLNNEHVNEEQEMIDSSSDNILIALIAELYERPLSLLLSHISLSDRLMNKMVLEFVASTQKLYPQILAYTVFAFFCALINTCYSAAVNGWTLLSMTNITQRKLIGMAI